MTESFCSEPIFSNSVISVKREADQNYQLHISWYRKLPDQNSNWLVAKGNSYICSPLDVGYFIQAKIQQPNNTHQFKLYGPVIMEQKLLVAQKINKFSIQIAFNQNITFPAFINLKSSCNNNIEIIIEKRSLILPIQHLAKNNWSNISRITQDPPCLIILIKSMRQQLVKFLQNMKIYNFAGDFIEICFQSNFQKNLFVFQLIHKQDQKQIKQYRETHQYKEYNSNVASMKSSYESKSVEKLQRLFTENVSELKQQDDNSELYDSAVLRDLYQVLQTPVLQNFQEKHHRPSDAQDIFSQSSMTQRKTDTKRNDLDNKFMKNKSRKDTKDTDFTSSYIGSQYFSGTKLYTERSQEKLENTIPAQQYMKLKNDYFAQCIKLNYMLISENERLRKQNIALKAQKSQMEKSLKVKQTKEFQQLKKFMSSIQVEMRTMNKLKQSNSLPRNRQRCNSKITPKKRNDYLESSKQSCNFNNENQDRKYTNELSKHSKINPYKFSVIYGEQMRQSKSPLECNKNRTTAASPIRKANADRNEPTKFYFQKRKDKSML